jgi:hypothetical protein
MELQRERLSAELLDPRRDFERVRAELEVRWDPLTGHSTRLVRASGELLPRSDLDLAEVGERFKETCPFCSERIERMTPTLPPELWPEGRIRQGEAVLFPNLLAYSAHSSVSVYSPERHFLPLGEMTQRMVADNLATQVQFARAVMRHDPEARWASINANHMLPSGSSLFHPICRAASIGHRRHFSGCWPSCRPSAIASTLSSNAGRGSAIWVRPVGSTGSRALHRSRQPSYVPSSTSAAPPPSSITTWSRSWARESRPR